MKTIRPLIAWTPRIVLWPHSICQSKSQGQPTFGGEKRDLRRSMQVQQWEESLAASLIQHI